MLNVKSLSERLGVSVATVYAMVESGEIECHRIRTRKGRRGTIRFSDAQVQAYLESTKVKQTAFPDDLLHIRQPS